MEQRIDEWRAEQNGENVGFAMDFRTEVMDEVGAKLEETMRLGLLGCFKEARQVSQSIAPVHQQKFQVVFEQLRLTGSRR